MRRCLGQNKMSCINRLNSVMRRLNTCIMSLLAKNFDAHRCVFKGIHTL